MTLGQLIRREWMDYSLLACLRMLFFLWTNETFAQHLLMIGCGVVLHIVAVVDIILLKTWFQSVNNSAVNPTNRRNKNTTTYCTKLPQHMPRTYYMSTTNGKMDQRWEHVHDAKKHDGSSPVLPNGSVGKCNGCSEKENASCSFGRETLVVKSSAAWKCTWNVVTMPLHRIFCKVLKRCLQQ